MISAILAKLDLDAITITVQRSGSSARTIAIGAAERTPEELCAALEAAWQVHSELAAFTLELDTDGKAVLTPPGGIVTITWGTGTIARDVLRFTGATTVVGPSSPVKADRQASGALFMALPIIDDAPAIDVLASESQSDTDAEVTAWGLQLRRTLTIRFQGSERSTANSEWRAYRDLWVDHLSTGSELVYAPDVSVASTFALVTAPTGRHSVRAVNSASYAPERTQQNFWGRWSARVELVEIQP